MIHISLLLAIILTNFRVIVLLHTSNHTTMPSTFVCATELLLLHTLHYYSNY